MRSVALLAAAAAGAAAVAGCATTPPATPTPRPTPSAAVGTATPDPAALTARRLAVARQAQHLRQASTPLAVALAAAARTAHARPAAPAPTRAAAHPGTAPAPGSTLVAGNPSGGAAVPAEAQAVDTSHPTRVVGTGTAASCTSAAVVAAVAAGGIVTFACGPAPVTITMAATAKIVNAVPRTVLDGGGLVTLSGGGVRRILYMDTCDAAQGYTTSHCQDQPTPRLTLQNLTFANGNSTGDETEGGGGGAVFVRGGRVNLVHDRFVGNRCDPSGPDLGGAAVRVLSQSLGLPVYVVDSTFTGGVCSNGGALSSIGVSWTVLDSVFTGNQAVGSGANPARGGTPGGGSGGAIYNDGNTMTLRVAGTVISGNHANEGGGAIFYVSNDRTGTLAIDDSRLTGNPNDGFSTAGLPGIFFLGRSSSVTGSQLS